MQAAPAPSAHVTPDSQIFTDGWDPRDWQKQQQEQQGQQQQHAAALIAPTMPQLYRPALVPPTTHPAFAAAVVAAGVCLRAQFSINIKRTHSHSRPGRGRQQLRNREAARIEQVLRQRCSSEFEP